jgi:hypothetical protein
MLQFYNIESVEANGKEAVDVIQSQMTGDSLDCTLTPGWILMDLQDAR